MLERFYVMEHCILDKIYIFLIAMPVTISIS